MFYIAAAVASRSTAAASAAAADQREKAIAAYPWEIARDIGLAAAGLVAVLPSPDARSRSTASSSLRSTKQVPGACRTWRTPGRPGVPYNLIEIATTSGETCRTRTVANSFANSRWPRPPRPGTRRLIGIGVGVVALALVVVMVWVALTQMSNRGTSGQVPNAVNGASVLVNPGKAKAGAKKVTLYVDYQCPIKVRGVLRPGGAADGRRWRDRVPRHRHDVHGQQSEEHCVHAGGCRRDLHRRVGRVPQATQEIFKQQEAEEIRAPIGYTDDFLKDPAPDVSGHHRRPAVYLPTVLHVEGHEGLTESMNKAAYDAGVPRRPRSR